MENKDKNRKELSRRNFFKTLGAGSVVTATAFVGCKPNNTVSAEGGSIGEVPTDKMAYRVNPHTGDRVSLLGYGCMRWPLRQKTDGSGEEEVDQDTVNDLVDYAIAHGVNYFDTAPVYVRGWSETATGIALKRHPRDKFFIATKMSNHRADASRSLEAGIAMYRKSMRDLQVDYLDYYLLHGVGLGGMDDLKKRFFDNGLLDFLLEERKAGRIRNLGWSYHGEVEVFDYLLAMGIQWDFVQIQLNYIDWQHASGWNTNAEYLLGELEKNNPILDIVLHNRASLLVDMGRYEEAMEDYNAILVDFPHDVEAFYRRGVLHLENHDRVKAEADFKRSEEIDPDNMFTKLSKALIFKLDDRWEDAEKIYTNLINNEPNPDPIFYMNRAECYVNTNQMFKASADLRSLGDTQRNNPYFYFLRGRVRLEQFDKVAAKADFEKAKTLGYDSSIVNEWLKKIE
jgi:diketogulonate reductase-like aldo/keto reductase/predicted negative regulator of RcsB-dependent stress response